MLFEGYYVKIVGKEASLAVVFGRNKNKKERSSFVQIITKDSSFHTTFEYDDYSLTKKPFKVKINKNIFNKDSMTLNINNDNLKVKGSVTFNNLIPIKYDAMGPFKFFPFMECKHSVMSMDGSATGSISINARSFHFENARLYIEGDKGRSFPKRYFWTQCNTFHEVENLSVMASAARIPYLGLKFTGTICIIHLNGKEYRLATYLGARVKSFSKNRLIIKQRRKLLEIQSLDTDKNSRELFAPKNGDMNRIIKENLAATVRYKFSIGKKIIFDVTSNNAAHEFSDT